MRFLSFVFVLSFLACLFSLLYLRYLTPFFTKGRAFFASEARTSCKKNSLVEYLGFFLFTALEIYLLSAWTAFCVRQSLHMASCPHVWGWLYVVAGFIICQSALGYIAVKDYRYNIFLVLRGVIPMGAFAAFGLNPSRIDLFYGWIIHLFSEEILCYLAQGTL